MGDLYNPFPRLPKNIRQVGERDQTVRLYLEDYVNTYLKRLYPKGGQDLRVGVLLGTAEERDGIPFLFVDGAMEVEDVTDQGEKVQFTETAWKKTYQTMEQMFPKRVILGWFLCGNHGCTLSPLNYWKEHGKYFAGKNQLMYLNGGLDGEEAVYVASEEGFCRLRGYSIYYERNQMMQDYMVLRKDVRRVETGTGDTVIRDFRQRMEENKSQVTARRGMVRVLSGLCTVLGIMVLAGGVTMVNNYEKMKEMEAVLASALPAGLQLETQEKDRGTVDSPLKDGQASQVVVEEIEGGLHLAVDTETAGTEGEGTAANGPGLPVTPAESAGMDEGAQEEKSGSAADGASGTLDGAETAADGGTGLESGGRTEETGVSAAAAGSQSAEKGVSGGSSSLDGEAPEYTPAQEAAAGQRLYLVQPGDTLYGICLECYGDGSRMDEICRLNGLEDVDKITAGQNLILP